MNISPNPFDVSEHLSTMSPYQADMLIGKDMVAFGDHALVQLPKKVEQTEGGIHIPERSKQRFFYGRVLSCGFNTYLDGHLVLFDTQGKIDLLLDPMRDEGLISLHRSQILGIISEKVITDRKLPCPAPASSQPT